MVNNSWKWCGHSEIDNKTATVNGKECQFCRQNASDSSFCKIRYLREGLIFAVLANSAKT